MTIAPLLDYSGGVVTPIDRAVPREIRDSKTAKMRIEPDPETPNPDESDDAFEKRRVRRRSREDSRRMTIAAVEQADSVLRRQFGFGIEATAKAMLANELDQQVDRIIESIQGREQTDRIELPRSQPKPERSPVGVLILAVTTAVVLVAAILFGSVISFRFADRLTTTEATQREKIAAVEARVIEAENRRLELETRVIELEKSSLTIREHDESIKKLQEHQAALVIFLLECNRRLLKDRGISMPDVPPILRITEAQYEDEFKLRSRP